MAGAADFAPGEEETQREETQGGGEGICQTVEEEKEGTYLHAQRETKRPSRNKNVSSGGRSRPRHAHPSCSTSSLENEHYDTFTSQTNSNHARSSVGLKEEAIKNN